MLVAAPVTSLLMSAVRDPLPVPKRTIECAAAAAVEPLIFYYMPRFPDNQE